MANERYVASGFGLALLLCVSVLALDRATPDPLASTTAEVFLERARSAGHAVELTARFNDDAPLDALVRENETTTQLLVSRDEVVIRPSSVDAPLLPPSVQSLIRTQWVRPFQRFGDYDGAVRGLARGYLDVLERAHEVRTAPRPPPILGPNVEAERPTTRSTSHWGLPLGLAVGLAGIWLSLRGTHATRN